MTELGAFQSAVATALLSPVGDAAPESLDAEGQRRFRVYRNNVHHGLATALGDAYPVVRRLVGDAFFQAMARAFVTTTPPKTRSLALFGDGFPAFVESFPPAARVPYLTDVALLERAALEALHAADVAPLAPAALTTHDEAVAFARFVPHPAARLVVSTHPVVSIWRANQPGTEPPASLLQRAETALVTRPDDVVLVQNLEPAVGRFAAGILHGHTAAAALADALACDPGVDPVAAWQPLLAGGALAGFLDLDPAAETV